MKNDQAELRVILEITKVTGECVPTSLKEETAEEEKAQQKSQRKYDYFDKAHKFLMLKGEPKSVTNKLLF